MQQLSALTPLRLCLPGFSLAQTLCCGQAFRWREQEDGSFLGAAGAHRAVIRQRGEEILIESDASPAFWENYFDCRTGGIRVLRQDGWEALASFIISQNNNIKRITGIIERLCCQFGEPIGGGLCAFPPPERLAGLSPEDLAPLRSGFRARYLIDAARQVTGGTVDLAALPALPTAEARAELMKIVGVGKKVADCALLFGFGHGDCFPVDVWIGRALAELLPEGLPPSLAPCAGIAQQMIFHYMRACPDRAAAKAGEC